MFTDELVENLLHLDVDVHDIAHLKFDRLAGKSKEELSEIMIQVLNKPYLLDQCGLIIECISSSQFKICQSLFFNALTVIQQVFFQLYSRLGHLFVFPRYLLPKFLERELTHLIDYLPGDTARFSTEGQYIGGKLEMIILRLVNKELTLE